jgi:hypothetical protein
MSPETRLSRLVCTTQRASFWVHRSSHPERPQQYQRKRGDITFKTSDIEILIAGCNDERRVDVGSDQLFLSILPRRASFDQTFSRQHTTGFQVVVIKQQPVADCCVLSGR